MDAVPHSTELRRVFGAFPTGVTVIAAVIDGVPVGLTASSFTSVSLDPPLVSVCIAHTSTTWPTLRQAHRLGVSVLGAHQERLSRQLSARTGNRFAGAKWRSSHHGEIVLERASAWLACSIHQEVPAGDHDLILLRVHDLDADSAVPPLVYHQSTFGRLHDPG